MEGKQKEMAAYGAIAFICLKLVKGRLEKMYFARNSNPLNMTRDKAGVTLSSEGEGEPIDSQTLYTFNYALKRLTKKAFHLESWKASNYQYRGAPYNYRSN